MRLRMRDLLLAGERRNYIEYSEVHDAGVGFDPS